jgi:uncharacterized protein (TIGR00297 family)
LGKIVIERIGIGVLLAGLLSAGAYRVGALTRSGAYAAAIIGSIVLGAGGWTPAFLLVLFFLSGSLFTFISRRLQPERQAGFAKGGRRDARQVLANGSLPALFSLLSVIFPEVNWLPGIVGALAGAAADTWATEWGLLARRAPRRITDWKQVPPGTSGGITPFGTLGSVSGALVIAGAASLLQYSSELLLVGILSGVLGSALDSVLGATVQVQYCCASCGKITEQHPRHAVCGSETFYHSGISWIDNDIVNWVANTFGALIAIMWVN